MFLPIQYLLSQLQSMAQDFSRDPVAFLITNVLRAAAVLMAITFHEVAHGYVAFRCGDPTAKMLGRLSLNPLKHLDVLGTLSLFFLGFGWAKPVPVNPRNFSNYRRDDFLVSVAGVVTNLTLFIIATAFTVGLYRHVNSDFLYYVLLFFSMFASINLGLGVFNLLPIPPLDGFHVLNDTLLGGRLRLTPQLFQISHIILLVLMFSGAFSQILSTVMSAIQSGVVNMFMRLTGAA